eukprot:7043540-Pyramimonas_sp.AAC.1
MWATLRRLKRRLHILLRSAVLTSRPLRTSTLGSYLRSKVSQRPTPRPDPVLEFLPTLVTTEQALRKCHPNKAAGMDGIVADLGRCANEAVARLVYPLLLKTCVLQREPLGFKSGEIVFFHK